MAVAKAERFTRRQPASCSATSAKSCSLTTPSTCPSSNRRTVASRSGWVFRFNDPLAKAFGIQFAAGRIRRGGRFNALTIQRVSMRQPNSSFLLLPPVECWKIVRERPRTKFDDSLHLAVSMRSFRAENVSAFVKALLDCDKTEAARAITDSAFCGSVRVAVY